MKVWMSLLVATATLTTSSCSGGSACSDVNWSSQIVLTTDQAVRQYADTARVRICQEDGCTDVEVILGAPTVEVSLSEFGDAIDDESPGTVTVSTLTTDGDVMARRTEDLDFSAWQPDGPGCGEWGRDEISISGDDFLVVPAARLPPTGTD